MKVGEERKTGKRGKGRKERKLANKVEMQVPRGE